MSTGISLLVGLGNPGQQYRHTRHNAGAMLLEAACLGWRGDMRPDGKVFGESGRLTIAGHDLRLLFPTTYMNHSGKAVAAMCQYFKIAPQNMLVAYDELDLPTGAVKLKSGGGHGGHNGLRDIIKALGTADFHRLRIGIGHPGSADKVVDYVLGQASRSEQEAIDEAIARSLQVLPLLCEGKLQIAMNKLHTPDSRKQDGI